ncbi:DNA-3-methyladenine glycosylase I [Campylobacter sp. RM9344]|uniref:DNA-3-methyladenine glycosylase I n=1 Tax=Campylobacter californiensis TaxID=1032243 RepID=A0AAW3ZVJ6_9BACT|nr:DNA-3-methyladenine glycosylase I [Campylobacter sp. RM6883]MBE2995704.1 DNA-3-methyladenine glycosylase I [Campylobacter sp. RM6913]MBE3029988.1 DNA-3-methyladenine glycosylase I [Campylobacter sp. RM9344]MBE3608071.1 DNA-3-methyladenine glycosylase I [Campylobacter sp. RM9337]
MAEDKKRCEWCEKDDLYRAYHDNEWGEIVRDERLLFELIVLEMMQAGLSWHTILKKREAMRVAFDDFKPEILAKYDEGKISELLQTEGIIKNRLKLNALSANAKAFLSIQSEFGSFFDYIWSFTNGVGIKNNLNEISQIPARSELSDQISKDMKKRGFKFLGSVTVYSFLQAIGVINDHLSYCFKAKDNL